MATPRQKTIDCSKPCVCHAVSRCVRRLLLLESTGADAAEPSRWKRMLSERLVQLVALFAIDVLEWAILGNHFHLVLATHPDLVVLWSDREVAVRWRTLTPDYHWRRSKRIPYDAPAQEREIAEMLEDPKAIARARMVLADISQFHKFLKQRIARLANAEAEVTGHFWEGRFKSIVPTDAEALIAHMVYVALNPVRAGLAGSLEECTFASVGDRIDELRRRIAAGEFTGEVEEAKRKLRSLKLLPALPCNPGDAVRGMDALPDGKPNPWKGGMVPSVLEGLTVWAFLEEAERAGRAMSLGASGRTLAPEAPSVLDALQAELEARLAVADELTAKCKPMRADGSPEVSVTPAEVRSIVATAARYAAPLEVALSRGLANAIGNFSGGLRSVAKRAAELGRRAVWTIFDPEGDEPRRFVEAEVSTSVD